MFKPPACPPARPNCPQARPPACLSVYPGTNLACGKCFCKGKTTFLVVSKNKAFFSDNKYNNSLY